MTEKNGNIVEIKSRELKKATSALIETTPGGSFFMPNYFDQTFQSLGLSPEKLVVPKDYHQIIKMCYDFYQRGGSVARVVDRLVELSITDIRNGQRKTTDEQNEYFRVVLHDKPSRLMRHLRVMALEYFLSGMVLPRIEWVEKTGKELSPDLSASKTYMVPVFDNYPPSLVHVTWPDWGPKAFWLKISDADKRAIRNKGGKIKEQQLRYQMWQSTFPQIVQQVQAGADMVEIVDTDPILRKELSITPYPTPYLFSVLESLIYKQQLRRMDYAIASRVINAILLVKEGNDAYPLTEDTNDNLENLKTQILGRAGDPRKQERLFFLFTNHTTTMEWIAPDVSAMLDQDKYRQVNEELDNGLGFPQILLTGVVRTGAQASEVSTWAIQPQMEELRDMFLEWVRVEVYNKASELNNFRNTVSPSFKPIKLQDFVKTAAVFQQLFAEGNVSRTTRNEMSGLDFNTEAELMKDEAVIAKGLPSFQPTPYSPPPPPIGGTGAGRPFGSQSVGVNKKNSGVKPRGQKPLSKVKASTDELLPDEAVLEMFQDLVREGKIYITMDDILQSSPESKNDE